MADEANANPQSGQTAIKAPGNTLKPYHFLRGIPSASVYAILTIVATGLAAQAGFMPTTINTVPTQILFGGVIFIAELVKEAFA